MLPRAIDVLAAAHSLRDVVERTPLVRSPALSAIAGTDVYLKCEQLQRTGSFKLRGASNALAHLSEDVRARGVVASSAGNHGLGLADAARRLGVHATIFVPANAPRVKRDGIRAAGADVDETQPHYDAAHAAAVRFAEETGREFVSPYAGEHLLAGQGTVAVEILEELPDVRTLLVPVGGGGLIGGIAAFVRAVAPHVRIVGVQGDASDAMARSLEAGHVVEVPTPPTLADGLSGQIDENGLAIGRVSIDEMRIVPEAMILAAIAFLAREHHTKVEGSGAVTVAALLAGEASFAGPVVAVLSGGNIDETRWSELQAVRA